MVEIARPNSIGILRVRRLPVRADFPAQFSGIKFGSHYCPGSAIIIAGVERMQKITVLLADDHTVVRQGLRALLAAEGDIEIVGEAGDGRQAVQMVKKLLPD